MIKQMRNTLFKADRQQSKQQYIMIAGLKHSGKSELLKMVKNTYACTLAPNGESEYGCSEEVTLHYTPTLVFHMMDMSGEQKHRNLWEVYARDADALIFVVDASVRLSHVIAREEIGHLLNCAKNKHVPFAIIFSKVDLMQDAKLSNLVASLNVGFLAQNAWKAFALNPTTEDESEISVIMKWIIKNIAPKDKK